jgi:hypothetical protein
MLIIIGVLDLLQSPRCRCLNSIVGRSTMHLEEKRRFVLVQRADTDVMEQEQFIRADTDAMVQCQFVTAKHIYTIYTVVISS